MVGLDNVTNTADTEKPVSTAQLTALNLKANLASPTFTGTVYGISKSMVGLSAVTNTTDAAKPVSTAQQTALNLKANLASPLFTGYIGIGDTARYPLEIVGSRTSSSGQGFPTAVKYTNNTWYGDFSAYNFNNSAHTFSCMMSHGLAVLGTYIVLASDKRIKENITDVPDNLSLQKLRDISCCYYEYKDKISKGDSKVFGFIAQQVREHMPMAVALIENIIPNEMRVINPQWTTLADASGYKLTIPDLQDVSSTKYKFYVTNDPSGDEVEKEIFSMENDPKSFIFEEQWQNVFLYGKEVDDFHTLNKQALFTLNFSATQEIDRIQQQEKTKLEEQTSKLEAAEAKIVTLETTLADVLSRLAALEN